MIEDIILKFIVGGALDYLDRCALGRVMDYEFDCEKFPGRVKEGEAECMFIKAKQ